MWRAPPPPPLPSPAVVVAHPVGRLKKNLVSEQLFDMTVFLPRFHRYQIFECFVYDDDSSMDRLSAWGRNDSE